MIAGGGHNGEGREVAGVTERSAKARVLASSPQMQMGCSCAHIPSAGSRPLIGVHAVISQ